ncbi:MAG TPA: hypothetical protein VGB63_13100 [Pedobacter sp.]|jgi:hypothetical protein
MSLFFNSDIDQLSKPGEVVDVVMTASFDIPGVFNGARLESFKSIEEFIPKMKSGDNRLFFSDGSWSNYELMEYLLQISGPALVGFTTWSISEIGITRMNEWVQQGQIIDLYAVLDVGIRNRKPHIYQQAIATLKNLKLTHCHAKVLSIVSPDISFLVVGSANFTKNPRKEAGVIICSRESADFSFNWIKTIVDGSSS